MKKYNSKLTRTSTNPFEPEGIREGKIFSVGVKELDSQYHDSGKREALHIKVEIVKANGELGYLYYSPTLMWSPLGKLMRTLQDLQAVPNMGEELDLNVLVGMPVIVTIENVERNNVVYSNIVKMKKREQVNQGFSTNRNQVNADDTDHLLDENLSKEDEEFFEQIGNLDLEEVDIDDL
jgi:hypothetical protein